MTEGTFSVHNIPRLDRAARRRMIRRAKKAKDLHTALRFLMIAKLGQGLSRQQVCARPRVRPVHRGEEAQTLHSGSRPAFPDRDRAFRGFEPLALEFVVVTYGEGRRTYLQ